MSPYFKYANQLQNLQETQTCGQRDSTVLQYRICTVTLLHDYLPRISVGMRHQRETAGTLFVAVLQQQINPLGWPILLQPAACTNLAIVGQGKADIRPLQVTTGDIFSALLETQDALGQRISQACRSHYLFMCACA